MSRTSSLLTTSLATGGVLGLAAAVGAGLDGFGARDDEVDARLPGDELHGAGAMVRTRAVAIAAPPAAVWPWLVQLGWGRAGWYSIDLLEHVLGVARSVDGSGTVSWRSVDEIVPAHQGLAVGDTIPLTQDRGLEVVALQPAQHLVGLLEAGGLRMVWRFVLVAERDGTRLLVRTAFDGRGAGVRVAQRVLLDPGHAVMEIAQLRGIRQRVERGRGRGDG